MYTTHNGKKNTKDTMGRENTTYLDNADETRKSKGTEEEEEDTTMCAESMGPKKNGARA